ncbi:MAG TPA: hypothetical protein DIT55_08260, partial [Spirochaetaceae bacterium]|nr:hypothetical protein [Spirochaetaceae bacterium]
MESTDKKLGRTLSRRAFLARRDKPASLEFPGAMVRSAWGDGRELMPLLRKIHVQTTFSSHGKIVEKQVSEPAFRSGSIKGEADFVY